MANFPLVVLGQSKGQRMLVKRAKCVERDHYRRYRRQPVMAWKGVRRVYLHNQPSISDAGNKLLIFEPVR